MPKKKPSPATSYDEVIKFRASSSLKTAIDRLAKAQGTKPSEFIRSEMRKLVAAYTEANRSRLLAKVA